MFVNSRRLLYRNAFFIILIACVLFIPFSSTGTTEPIRDGDYIYIDDSKAYLKGTYSATPGQNIEHWAMTKQFTGDCDMAIGFNGEVAWPTKVLFEDPHHVYWNTDTSKTFYYVTDFALTTDNQDYGNWYNPLKYKFNHKVFSGYDSITNEPIWQDVIGTVVYFDLQENDGVNYTATWHTEHSRFEQYRDISHRILANPIEYEFDGKNVWYITKNIPMTANEMRKIVIEMDGKIELGEQSYKYDIIWKPSHQTIVEAKVAGNLYVLDPYWNTSWAAYSTVTMNTTAPENEFQVHFSSDDFTIPLAMWNEMNQGGNDTRILNYNHTIDFPHWIEHITARDNFSIWVNVTNNDSATYQWYYGNPSASSTSDGDATFLFFDDFETAGAGDWTTVSSAPDYDSTTQSRSPTHSMELSIGAAWEETKISLTASDNIAVEQWVYCDLLSDSLDMYKQGDGSKRIVIQADSANNIKYYDGAWQDTGINAVLDSWEKFIVYDFNWSAGTFKLKYDGNIANCNMQVSGIMVDVMHIAVYNGITYFDDVFVCKYDVTAPIISDISSPNYYLDSLHYNATSNYNHTVESDGTITSNRSVVIADDTDDTALSTGTTHLTITQFNNSADIARNFTIFGDNLDWYQVANISGQYALKNSSGTLQTVSNGNFTIDLSAGDYWIESVGAIITLLSQTPSIICQNCTGDVRIVYGITTDSSGLNNTSVSFIYRNYDPLCGCSNHSIRPPTNNLATEWDVDGRILRAANRNETLNFEDNATITGGNTYSWSGLDENSSRLSIEAVNSTYFRVYINGTVHDVMPQAWYLDRSDLQEAPKTTVSIHKNHNILVKFWEFELFKGNTDFLGVGYTDTVLNSNPALWPSDANPVSVYYLNDSYDPATGGDPLTSGFAVYMLSLNASEWTDHVYEPHTNSSYVRGFINNSLLKQYINTTNISYILYVSNTPQSKAFQINVTDVASSTNVSFDNTGVLWTGDTTYTPEPYTPNIWFSFMKNNITFDHKLYVADNNDRWTNSTLNSTVVGTGLFPPTKPSFYAFHNGFQDFDMNGTYYGTIKVQVSASSDPDGGAPVVHNLTLHYGENNTYIATINNSAVAEDGVYTNISFNTTPYYSQTELYTLRVVATDDENESVTVWLGVNFSLDGSPRIILYSPETPTTSDHGVNQTFSINTNLLGNVTWYIDSIEVFNESGVNNSTYSNNTALIGIYNVTVVTTNINGSNSMKWDWTVESIGRMPLSIFIMWSVIMFAGAIIGFMTTGLYGITSSLLTATIAYMNSKNIINGNVVQYFAGESTTDTIEIGYRSIESLPLSYIFLFIAIVMVVIFILHTVHEIQYYLDPDIGGEMNE